jgi:hypothetical protein
MLDNVNTLNNSVHTLKFYDGKPCLVTNDANQITVDICLRGIKSARCCMKQEITKELQAKEQYQLELVSDIINRKYRHVSPSTSLSEKLELEDFIDRKLKHIFEATARRNMFTMLNFDIKGFIDEDSIKRNALARVDGKTNG